MPARGVCWFFPGSIFPAVRFLCVLSALFPWPTTVQAQTAHPATLSSDNFQRTVRQSGLIFEGTVTAIQCEVGRNKAPQTYRISFQVRQGVRGASTGATLVIREWAGLWSAGPQRPRYHVGERAFLFLYPPSRAGLTSTVGGRNGKLAVSGGQVVLPRDWAESVGQTPVPAAKLTPSQPALVPVAWLVQRIEQAGVTPISAVMKGGK